MTELHIVGGTYYETCREPAWYEMYGSGFRATHALSEKSASIVFHTCIGNEDFEQLLCLTDSIDALLKPVLTAETASFLYDHPLSSPIFPTVSTALISGLIVNADLVLQYGMIEGSVKTTAKKVVYDPQSPGNPLSFWLNDSYAEELVWVANKSEVETFTGCTTFEGIKDYLFDNERVTAAIIKCGTNGAILLQKGQEDLNIPVFKTKKVWPIGTGDIFTAVFAYKYLIENQSLQNAAIQGSLATAYYTETTILPIPQDIDHSKFQKFYGISRLNKKVYLAGPFFTMAQRWLIEQFRDQLIGFGFTVFSPFHDVGFGIPEEVVPMDIDAINQADIIFAIIDGLDSGTLFEIGYARARDIAVVAFVENEKIEALTMLQGTNCIIESDFSTAIYKTVWEAFKN